MANRNTPIKKRSQSCYNNKVKNITDWYNNLTKSRKEEVINPNTKQPVKRKELKSLNYYIDLVKKSQGENK
jgi:benzoyl-CoA reductase/2-hydroxyglutaryl-CoA dehydratase subunit BcrC/BadD/HgdB